MTLPGYAKGRDDRQLKRQGCKLIRRDVVQGLEQALQPLAVSSHCWKDQGSPGMLEKLQQGYSGGLGHSLFTNNGNYLVMLVPGQLNWWKLMEHHSYLWELISVLSKCIS